MSDELAQREMTLKEWMARLPATHTANVELAALERELAEAQSCLRVAEDTHAHKVMHYEEEIVMMRRVLGERNAELAEARAQLETERLQLAACGVAAMQNTEASVKERLTRDNPYWSASYGDVCAAVDREMAHRAEVDRLTSLHAASIRDLRQHYAEEVERAARWFYGLGQDDMNAAYQGASELGFDAAWSRYQQERRET